MNRPNPTGNESAPAGTLRRRRRDRGIEDPVDAAGKKKLRLRTKRGGDLSIEDRIEAAGRELLSVGWYFGVPVGGSLALATWAGHFEPVRSSLALLATAAIVVMVLGSDAFRQGGERGFGTPDRVTFGGTAIWVMLCGGLGAMLTAMALPWLGPAHPWLTSAHPRLTWLTGKVVLVGFVAVVGFVLGIVLSSPLVLAFSALRARGREDESPPEEPMKARAGEFVADPGDPFSNDTLGRREQVEEFCERVRATATPVVWAVEGAWGSGRTAFSRMCAAVLRNDPGVAAVVAVDARTQGVTGMPLVDLAVAVGRELESASREQTGESERRRRRSRLAELAGAVAEPRLLLREFGRGESPPTDTVEKMSRLVREYMDSLNGLAVVWIDELDRCPPEYALGMLGAVRSICHHAGIATVVTVRPDTLAAAVARIHGDHHGAGGHLRGFIDEHVPLAPLGAAPAGASTAGATRRPVGARPTPTDLRTKEQP